MFGRYFSAHWPMSAPCTRALLCVRCLLDTFATAVLCLSKSMRMTVQCLKCLELEFVCTTDFLNNCYIMGDMSVLLFSLFPHSSPFHRKPIIFVLKSLSTEGLLDNHELTILRRTCFLKSFLHLRSDSKD